MTLDEPRLTATVRRDNLSLALGLPTRRFWKDGELCTMNAGIVAVDTGRRGFDRRTG